VVIFVAFRNSEQLTMALLGYVFLLTLGLVASLVPNWLLDSGMETNVIEALQVGWLIAIGVAIFVTAFILLLIVSAAAAGWHQDSRVSFAQAFKYVLLSLLGRRLFSLDVKEGAIQGADDEKEALEKYGGPGRLRVYPGQAVVLHKHGMTTRAVGPGTVMVSKREKVQTIVPLEIKVGVFEYENVLTRDRVPLTLKVAHGAQIETVAETQQRLLDMKDTPGHNRHIVQRLQNIVNSGNWIGEPPNNFYVGIAEMIAKTPAEATKGKVEVALRDVFMSFNLEDLFVLDNVTGDTPYQDRIDRRRIAQIEKFITEKLKDSVKGDALGFKFVDINEIRFPEELEKETRVEAISLMKARIRETEAEANANAAKHEAAAKYIQAKAEAKAQVLQANAAQRAAAYQAITITTVARANAVAEGMRDRAKYSARQAFFDQVIKMLKLHNYDQDTVSAVLQQLAASSSIQDEFERIMKMMKVDNLHEIKQEIRQGLPETAVNSLQVQ
jgi:regulator of protease activity HflC (stomatin/prohibitin superfamily)/uncharacterized membrane protein (DUF485 family)